MKDTLASTEPPASFLLPEGPAVPDQQVVATLFDLGRQVTSVLELDELLPQIPQLIGRLIPFEAFAVYLLDEKRGELTTAYSVGYPAPDVPQRLKIGEGLVGAAVAEQRPMLANDVSADARYVAAVPDMGAELVVPLLYKKQTIGALHVLSRRCNQYTVKDMAILRQFGVHLAVALVNARLFDQVRADAEAFETLAEIGRDVAAVLDLDELLTHIAQLTRRVIDYRTFGILLLNEAQGELEFKVAIQYGERVTAPRVRLGEGLVGYAALHKEPVLVADVSRDPRYIKLLDDVKSELVIPMLVKDRCIGVFDLESPEPDAFTRRHAEILTLLASQAAVAIENARLYETVRANEERLDREVRFAQRVQIALLPSELPRRLKGVDLGAYFSAALELGGDFYDVLTPEPNTLIVAVGDVSGKGVPTALYGAYAGELVRGRTYRRRYTAERSSPAGVLLSMNAIMHQRQLEEYYCTLCYALFDLKRRTLTFANSGLPYPIHCTAGRCAPIELPGVPLGFFPDSTYDELSIPLQAGEVFVFCSDGVSEAMDADEQVFGTDRLLEVVGRSRHQPAQGIVDAIVAAVTDFRGGARPNDDATIVVVRVTA